jgi:hypothetical protein
MWIMKLVINKRAYEENGNEKLYVLFVYWCTVVTAIKSTKAFINQTRSMQMCKTRHAYSNNSAECRPWEASIRSASQQVPIFLWNRKLHAVIHKNSPLVPIIKDINSLSASHPICLNSTSILWLPYVYSYHVF